MAEHSNTGENGTPSNEARRGLAPREIVKQSAERWLARNRSLVLRQTPVWAQSLAGIVITLSATAVAAGFLFRIDEIVTVTGQLVSISGSIDVKTPVGGKVAEVLFEDGSYVEKGQPLVRFDTRQALANEATSRNLIQLERADLKERLSILSGKEEVLKQKLKTTEEITGELSALVSAGGFQRFQYLRQLDELYELRNQLANVQLEKSRTKLEAEKSIGQLSNNLKQAELQLQYSNVVAPASGVIFEPKARLDGVIGAGNTILTIIPQQGLKAQVFVANKDIGFVKKGQKAQIRVDAFPFTQYGELKGRVTQIGADALPPDEKAAFYRYPVKLSVEQPFLENKGFKIPLRSGMAIRANLKLRDKRVISLISDMLIDQTDSIKSIRQQ